MAACVVQVTFSASVAFIQLPGLPDSLMVKAWDAEGRAKFGHLNADQPHLPSASLLLVSFILFLFFVIFSPSFIEK